MAKLPGGEGGSENPGTPKELTPDQQRFKALLTEAVISMVVSKKIIKDIVNASPRQMQWLETRLNSINRSTEPFLRSALTKTLSDDWDIQKRIY